MTLLRLGPAATNAIPKLRSLFDDESETGRIAATNAVRAIERPRASGKGEEIHDRVEQRLAH